MRLYLRQGNPGRGNLEAIDLGLLDDGLDRDAGIHQALVDRRLLPVHPNEGERTVSLGVKVHEESSKTLLGQCRTEIDRGCGLSHATLLIGYRDYHQMRPRNAWSLSRRRPAVKLLFVLCAIPSK